MKWTPLVEGGMYLNLYPSDFGDDTTGLRCRRPKAASRNDKRAPIRIPFTTILDHLVMSVRVAIIDRDREHLETTVRKRCLHKRPLLKHTGSNEEFC
ncbi:hypothetical protein CH63R_14486 [Colletotrichum higginsianum IMI 349063]|uniref:Uncharacterized protein n=1 Tax=Colletotrichum higginsianum (strain IMI 349063) TaxID=759273 RepID=A0A1B7XQZ6_COLHI|nr:hypothetical protein CH63R_14486 [Colletotrichum higginsianum IMI 349063]OBR02185.1 hypothetical protein CH63R_14486 [Colletotrichum higginsianum IMI 349063]